MSLDGFSFDYRFLSKIMAATAAITTAIMTAIPTPTNVIVKSGGVGFSGIVIVAGAGPTETAVVDIELLYESSPANKPLRRFPLHQSSFAKDD
jgi:hypothetical protein